MNVPAFIIGNGLSMALSPQFSIKKITTNFIESMEEEDKSFLQEIASCHMKERTLNFDDFEENFAGIEIALDSVKKYNQFLSSKTGNDFLCKYKLNNPELEKHLKIIDRIYTKYIMQILGLIKDNVHKEAIENNLRNFVQFVKNKLDNAEKSYIFTLNYDLLMETILLDTLGSDKFIDFCYPSGKLKGTNINKFDFNPDRAKRMFPTSEKVELHHLHGSLSFFFDSERERAVKLKSQDITLNNIYEKIKELQLPLTPAIITGGGKSKKITQYPFDYYYTTLKNLCDVGEFSELYIIGYSFRDEHINKLIKTWMDKVEQYKDGLKIIDYKTNQSERDDFVKFVTSKLKKKQKQNIPIDCFIFGGANEIISACGTRPKPKKIKIRENDL